MSTPGSRRPSASAPSCRRTSWSACSSDGWTRWTRPSPSTKGLEALVTQIPRLFLIESEYHLALRRAEAEWIRGLLTEFTDGSFPGMREWRHFHETGVPPADVVALVEKDGEAAAGS